MSMVDFKLELIYIIEDDANINFRHIDNEKTELFVNQVKCTLMPNYKNDIITILENIDYLDLETIKLIDKHNNIQKNRSIKKINKEHLITIFMCMGFNIIYCPLIAEKILIDLQALINIKTYNDSDSIMNSIVIRQKIFFDIAKNVIKRMTGTKCHLSKYFNLSYLIVSK